jgi:hypothetical protein
MMCSYPLGVWRAPLFHALGRKEGFQGMTEDRPAMRLQTGRGFELIEPLHACQKAPDVHDYGRLPFWAANGPLYELLLFRSPLEMKNTT